MTLHDLRNAVWVTLQPLPSGRYPTGVIIQWPARDMRPWPATPPKDPR